MKFASLGLAEPLVRAVASEGYTVPTPIQQQAIPHILAGRDILGCAQTGTGKTAAFALPILHRMSPPAPTAATETAPGAHGSHAHGAHAHAAHAPRQHHVLRTLVLSPTRELAVQIAESFKNYGKHLKLRNTVIFGGVSQHHQVKALKAGVDIVVATPGRLLDLMNQGYVDLRNIEVFVLDEADRMLDMGFIHDIRKIVAKIPQKRQTLFFSATMPSDIKALADRLLNDPVSVQVAPVASTVDLIDQSVYFVPVKLKPQMLAHLIKNTGMTRTLVFTRTKHGADKVVKSLEKASIPSEAIHGNKSQNARQRALSNFKTARTAVLVATDIAARGIDIDDISHVINYDLPNVPETYVHRIGRTARAGASGNAVSLCDNAERSFLKDIERLTRKTIPVRKDMPQFAAPLPSDAQSYEDDRESRGSRNERSHGGGSWGSKKSHPAKGAFFAPRNGSGRKPSGTHAPRGPAQATGHTAATSKPAHASHSKPAHAKPAHPKPHHAAATGGEHASKSPAHAARQQRTPESHGSQSKHPMHTKHAATNAHPAKHPQAANSSTSHAKSGSGNGGGGFKMKAVAGKSRGGQPLRGHNKPKSPRPASSH